MHRHFTPLSTHRVWAYMSGELRNDMITKWGQAGQLFKQPGLLVCLRQHWGALSLSIQKLWYLHSSSVINILYDPTLANVSPADLSPPATFFKHFLLFPHDCLNLFQVKPEGIQCDLSPPLPLLLSIPVACQKNMGVLYAQLFNNQRDRGICSWQQHSKTWSKVVT